MTRHCATCLSCISSSNPPHRPIIIVVVVVVVVVVVITIITPFLQMRKQRHREAKFFAQAHTASKSQSWDSGWGGLSPCAVSHFALTIAAFVLV